MKNRKIVLLTIVLILTMTIAIFIYLKMNKEIYNQITKNIEANAAVSNNGATIEMPEYNQTNGWALGEIKDINITVDFGDETSDGKKVEFTLPDGLEYMQITAAGIIEGNEHHYSTSKVDESNVLNTMIKKTILPEINAVENRKFGKVVYEINNNIRRLTINLKARVSVASYYTAMEIPNPLVLEGFKGGLRISNVQIRVRVTGQTSNMVLYQEPLGAYPRTVETYSSLNDETLYGYNYTVIVNGYRPTWSNLGGNMQFVKNVKLHLYLPKNMEYERLDWLYSGSYSFINFKLEYDRINNKVIIQGDYVGYAIIGLKYKIPVGLAPGVYEASANDYFEYETFDGIKRKHTYQHKNSVKIINRNNFVNKLSVEASGDFLETTTKGGAYVYTGEKYVNKNQGFYVRNLTPGYKRNQIVEYAIDPSLEMLRVRFPYDKSVITNTVPTYIEYKTAENPEWTRTNVTYKVYGNAIELKASEFPVLKNATALRVKIGTIGSDYRMHYTGDINADFGYIQTLQRLKPGNSQGKIVFNIYGEENRGDTISTAEYILKEINDNEVKLSRAISHTNTINLENIDSVVFKWGETFNLKKEFFVASYGRDNIRTSYLRNPIIYIREPNGIKYDEESIKLFKVHQLKNNVMKKEQHPIRKEIYNISNGNKVIKIIPIGDYTLGDFLDGEYEVDKVKGLIEVNTRVLREKNGNEEVKDLILVEGKNINWDSNNSNEPVIDKYDVNKNGNTTEKMLSSFSKIITFQENRNVNVSTEVVIDGKKYIYTAGDNTTIPKFTAQTAGTYDIKLNNWSTGPAQSVELYIPVPKTGMNFGANFQKEEFKFDMNLTEIKNLPSNYIVEYSKNATSADNYQTAIYEQNVDNLSDVTMIRIKNKNPIPENQEDRISIGMRINETYENTVVNNKNGKINIFNPVIKVNSPTYEGTLKGTTAAVKLFIPKIKGIVFSDDNGDGISNGEIDRLNNLTVELYKENTKVADTTTNSKGEFSFDENQIKDETNYEIRVTRPSQKFITWKNEEAGNEAINSDAEKGEGNYDVIKNINPVAKSSGELGIGYISLKSEATLPELRVDKTVIKQGESIGINFGIPLENHKKTIKNLTDSGYKLEFNGGSENVGNVAVTETGDTYTAPTLNPGEKERTIKIYKTATLDGTEEVGEPITIRVVTNVPPTITANEITSFVGDNEKDYKTILSAQNVASENIVLTDDNFVVENLAPVADGKYTQAGTYKITYKVKDEYGNEAIKESKIKVNEPAKIITKDIVVVENNLNALDTNIRASWKRAGNEIGEAEEVDLTNNVTKTVTGPTQDFSKPGEYTVRYSVESGGRTVEKEIKVIIISDSDVKNGDYTLIAKDIEIEQKEALIITKDQILEKAQAILYKEENNVINKIADGQTLNKEKFEIESAKIEEIKATKSAGKEYTLRITARDGNSTISKEIKVKVKADAGKISAINELDQKANEKIAEIRVRQDLTSEEKTAAEAQINGILNSAKEEIDGADTEEKVNTAKNNRISEIDGVNPTSEAKPNAVRELESQANEKIAEIRGRQDLTTEEKEEAIENVNQRLNEAKQLVETSETNAQVEDVKIAGIGSINGINPIATVKPNAKNAVKEAADNKINEIRDNISLTNEEKLIEIEKINQKLEEINNNINAALGNTDVDNIKNAAINEINDIEVESTIKPDAIAELQTKAEEKIAEIRARQDLTSEEKSAAETQIKEILNSAKEKIEKADTDEKVNNAKNTGISAIDGINPVGTLKKNAIAELERKANEKIEAIKSKQDLTNEEKTESIAKVNQKLNEAKTAIDSALTNANVDSAKNSGLSGINGINPASTKKTTAKTELEAKANAKIVEINVRKDLTNEEKSAAIALVNQKLNEAKTAIDNATTNENVDIAKTSGLSGINGINPAAITKTEAKAEIDRKADEKIAEIEARTDLTVEEKETAKKLVEIIRKNAKNEIDNAVTNEDVENAKNAGIEATKEINPKADTKENAKKLIDEAIKSKKNNIDSNNNLTQEEKDKLKAELDEIARIAKEEINKLTTNDEVTAKTEEVVNTVNEKEIVGKIKAEAKAEIDRKADEKIAEINARKELTNEEKQALIEKVNEEREKAKKAIDNARTNEEVKNAKDNGISTLIELEVEGKVKKESIETLKKLLEENKKEIDARKDLTKEEKEELKKKLDDELKKAVEAIENATTNAEIEEIKNNLKEIIETTDMVGIKTEILKELESLINKQKEEIDNRKDLTEEEKEVIKRLLDDKLNEAKRRLYEAETKEEVEKIKQELIDYINNPKIDQNLIDNLVQKLEEEAKKAKEKIDARTDITEEEKAKLKKEIDEKLERQKNILNNFNKGKIIIKYIDIETLENIIPNEEIYEVIETEYKVESKDIEYYVLMKEPEIQEGKIELGTKTLEYQYRKQIFNLEVKTELNNASIDGNEIYLNNKKLAKIELTKKQIANSKLKVNYKLTVKNTGEISGKGKLEIEIPQGFKVINSNWEQQGNKVRTEEIELNVKQEKEFDLELEWINNKEGFGVVELAAEIVETQNDAKYEETNSENETKDKKSTILLTVKTGETEIKSIGLIGLITVAISIVVLKRKK